LYNYDAPVHPCLPPVYIIASDVFGVLQSAGANVSPADSTYTSNNHYRGGPLQEHVSKQASKLIGVLVKAVLLTAFSID